MTTHELIIIGGGPKAIAIIAKAYVLSRLGYTVPSIALIEKNTIGGNWDGKHGFTDGNQLLGTPPDKDIGFPYDQDVWRDGGAVNAEMQKFSWQNFLISQNSYTDWVDRGKPHPTHKLWSDYLVWIFKQTRSVCDYYQGCAHTIEFKEGSWEIAVEGEQQNHKLKATSGLMLTGPGETALSKSHLFLKNFFSTEKFWMNFYSEHSLRVDKSDQAVPIAIIGAGESAATIAMSLTRRFGDGVQIEIYSPSGMCYSRGESYHENKIYSLPDKYNWQELTPQDRLQFIKRTDSGVFSLQTQSEISLSQSISICPGVVEAVREVNDGLLQITSSYGEKTTPSKTRYKYVIDASGVSFLSFLQGFFSIEQQAWFKEVTGISLHSRSEIEQAIDHYLSIEGCSPKLHIPGLSAFTQGPGYANLSCLGSLADRVLLSHVTKPQEEVGNAIL